MTQAEWASFQHDVWEMIDFYAEDIYFHGHSNPGVVWQNAAWHFNVPGFIKADELKYALNQIRLKYRQDSIAWSYVRPEHLDNSSAI